MNRANQFGLWFGVLLCLLAGCKARQWQPFENLSVGKPAPKNPPPNVTADKFGWAYLEPVPTETRGLTRITGIVTKALQDPNGIVIAKSYTYLSLACQFVCTTGQYTYIIEMEIPAESFHDAPTNWQASEEMLLFAKLSPFGASLMNGKSAPTSLDQTKELLVRRLARVKDALDNPPEYTGDWKKRAEIALRYYFVKLGGPLMEPLSTTQAATQPVMPPYQPANVPEYMLFTNILLDIVPGHKEYEKQTDSNVLALMIWFNQPGHSRLVDLLNTAGAFRHVTRPGYNWMLVTWDGVVFQVRNMGQRRVRVEVSGPLLRDVFFYLRPPTPSF